jgi:polyprenyl-phospho-N-acetylgalactosaminyl synthase
MNLLQVFFIVSGVIILVLAFDVARKQKFNALHFLVFIGVGAGLLVFTFSHSILQTIWDIFWLQRGADVLVYGSIIFLLYFVLLLLNKHVENKDTLTGLVRELAIGNSNKKSIKWNEVFLIRVYNEESVISDVLKDILKKNYKNILVVNDGSTDMSKDILESFWEKIILLNHYRNRWAWAALETGFEYLRRFCKADYVVCFDADKQHSLWDLGKFFVEFERDKELDIVLGSRFITKTTSNVPFLRRSILFLGSIFTFFISHIKLTDSHNGYRVMRMRALEKLKLTMDGMEYASELVENIYKHKLKFQEVPVNVSYTKYSLEKGQKCSNAFNIALKVIWNKFFR